LIKASPERPVESVVAQVQYNIDHEKANQRELLNEYKRESLPKPPPVEGKYRTITIDPPWPIEKVLRDARPNQFDIEYPTMTLDEIAELPIPDLASEDGCHIYLWTTHKHLPDALDLLEGWGADYQCLLTWVKNVGFTPFSFMYSTEHCLFAHIGSLPLLKMGERLDFSAKVREHSRKPEEFYALVRKVSPGPRLDMFGREQREGFATWGNETEKFKAEVVV
jgi:N6-adenosine-specific RNA methylase IME4